MSPRIDRNTSDDIVQRLGDDKTSLVQNNAQHVGVAFQMLLNIVDTLITGMIGFGYENDPVRPWWR